MGILHVPCRPTDREGGRCGSVGSRGASGSLGGERPGFVGCKSSPPLPAIEEMRGEAAPAAEEIGRGAVPAIEERRGKWRRRLRRGGREQRQ
jgi:hypothetical protein